jgi:hypothetical protein
MLDKQNTVAEVPRKLLHLFTKPAQTTTGWSTASCTAALYITLLTEAAKQLQLGAAKHNHQNRSLNLRPLKWASTH